MAAKPLSITRWAAVALGLAVLFIPSISLAHTFRSEGSITVLLHIDPDDTPATNSPSQLNFYVFDGANKFLGSNCICVVTVSGNGQTVLSQSATFYDSGFNHAAKVPVSWPTLGVYQIELVGQPKSPGDFQPFDLNYIQRVAIMGKPPASKRTWSELVLLVVANLAGAVTGVVVVRKYDLRLFSSHAEEGNKQGNDT